MQMPLPRCDACPCAYRPLPGTGPRKARILALGDRPSAKDNDRCRIFSGPPGQELDDTYLRLAGLDRDDIRIENVVRCWTENSRTPSEKEIKSCSSNFIPYTLADCEPEIVILLGAKALLVADGKHRKLEVIHGRPYWGSLMGGEWEGWIWPMMHPNAGMQDTSKMSNIITDFENLGRWLRGQWEPPQQDVVKDYALIETKNEFDEYVGECAADDDNWLTKPAVDTETHNGKDWSLQFSIRRHTGRMILSEHRDLCRYFNEFMHDGPPELIMLHNAPQDLDSLCKMGVTYDQPLRDTMAEAFHLGSLPQGLKALAAQLVGADMTSWEETVKADSVDMVMIWLGMASAWCESNLRPVEYLKTFNCVNCGHRAHLATKARKKGECKDCGCVSTRVIPQSRPQKSAGVLEGMFNHLMRYAQNESYDVWDSFDDLILRGLRSKYPGNGEIAQVYAAVGPLPSLGIANCDMARAVTYACGDADYTGQVGEVLETLRGDAVWLVGKQDWDKYRIREQ